MTHTTRNRATIADSRSAVRSDSHTTGGPPPHASWSWLAVRSGPHALQGLVDAGEPAARALHQQLSVQRGGSRILVDELQDLLHTTGRQEAALLHLQERERHGQHAADTALQDEVHGLHDRGYGQPLAEEREPAVRQKTQRLDLVPDEVAPHSLEVPL